MTLKTLDYRFYMEIGDEKNKENASFFGNNCAKKQKSSGFSDLKLGISGNK